MYRFAGSSTNPSSATTWKWWPWRCIGWICETVVRQVDQDVVDERRDDRLGRRELLAVQHEARRTVPQEHRVLDGDVGPVQGTPVIRLGLDEEGPYDPCRPAPSS